MGLVWVVFVCFVCNCTSQLTWVSFPWTWRRCSSTAGPGSVLPAGWSHTQPQWHRHHNHVAGPHTSWGRRRHLCCVSRCPSGVPAGEGSGLYCKSLCKEVGDPRSRAHWLTNGQAILDSISVSWMNNFPEPYLWSLRYNMRREAELEMFYVRNAKTPTGQMKWITMGIGEMTQQKSAYYSTKRPGFRPHYLHWEAHKCL